MTRFSALILRHPASWHAYLAPDGGDLPNGDEAYITNSPIDPRCAVTPGPDHSYVRCPHEAEGVTHLGPGQVWFEVAMYYQQRDGGVRDDVTVGGYHARISGGGPESIDCSDFVGGQRSLAIAMAPTSDAVQPSEILFDACFGSHAPEQMMAFHRMLRSAVIDSRADESVPIAGAGSCRRRDLRLRQDRDEGVNSAEALMNFTVTNHSARTCEIGGFPSVVHVADRRQSLAFTFQRLHVHATRLFLAPGETALFGLSIWTCQWQPHINARTASIRLPGVRRRYEINLHRGSLMSCGDTNSIEIEPLDGN